MSAPVTVEIFSDDQKISKNSFKNKDGKTIDRFFQIAYLVKQGQRFPELFHLPMEDATSTPHPAGIYHISPSAFQINKYNSVEMNPFSFGLIPARQDQKPLVKAAG